MTDQDIDNQQGADQTDAEAAPAPSAVPGWRRRLRLPLMTLGPVILAVAGAYLYLTGGRFESTDDAYVRTARIDISANVSGRIQVLAVHDNQLVHQGEILFRLDDAPFRIAVEEAGAKLAAARLHVESLKAAYLQRQADLKSAQARLAFLHNDYDRQRRLLASGVASRLQVDRAQHDFAEARAQAAAASEQVSEALAELDGNADIAPDRHPEVQQAQALLDRAELNLSYTVVAAPCDGVVTRVDQIRVGSYVNAAAPVFALIPRGDLWIEANFKEDQLTHLRIGQRAEVRIDSYPGRTFTGRVASISPGTGSIFSLLPPENATGNWVKVVQRVPVRVELDHLDPAFPLRGGLSAKVTVDTHYQRHFFDSAEAKTASAAAAR
jgi:membrane fusion protein (multidrug efflux system)